MHLARRFSSGAAGETFHAFCTRAKACGFTIWSHKNVKLTHTGVHTFSFNEEKDMLERYKLKGDIT